MGFLAPKPESRQTHPSSLPGRRPPPPPQPRPAPPPQQGQSWRRPTRLTEAASCRREHQEWKEALPSPPRPPGRKRFLPRPAHHTTLGLCVVSPSRCTFHASCSVEIVCRETALTCPSPSAHPLPCDPVVFVNTTSDLGSRHSPAPSHLWEKTSFSLACDLTPVWPKALHLRPHSPYLPVQASPGPRGLSRHT